jgi:hypothetical protein
LERLKLNWKDQFLVYADEFNFFGENIVNTIKGNTVALLNKCKKEAWKEAVVA